MPWLHSIRAGLLALALAATATGVGGQAPVMAPATFATFRVFVRAVPVGSEEFTVQQTADGWVIRGSGQVGEPIGVVTRRLEVRYTADWRPIELSIMSAMGGQESSLTTTISGATARNVIGAGGTATATTAVIDPTAVLLPSPHFAPYAALAARLRTATPGSTIPIYLAPQGSLTATVGASASELFETTAGPVAATRTALELTGVGIPSLEVHLWTDAGSNLLRISVPGQGLEVVREDLAAVSTRRVTMPREGDESVRIAANGFILTGTLSVPSEPAAGRRPAVVLVGRAESTDRDEVVAGVPIFAQLADDLADRGYLVLRYDRRGTGQSGGRPESATLDDYAEDLRAAVRLMRDRRDVDRDRLAVLGYADGGPVAMIAAEKDDRIRALVLAATPGTTGEAFTMAQAARSLDREGRTGADRQAALALQERIHRAVLTGRGWDGISLVLRSRADTPWFQTYLKFDPERLIRDVRQPLLILQGALDTEVPPEHAARLADLARARRRSPITEVAVIPGLNHQLTPAITGEPGEYAALADSRVSPTVAETIERWLAAALPPSQ